MRLKTYDVIVIGSGAAGMIAAITTAKKGKKTLLLEKLPTLGTKLKATGGGRCNLSNTLNNIEFMNSFGKNGRFMTEALNMLDHNDLIIFFKQIGVQTHIPDGFRIFPVTHNSSTIIKALENELLNLDVEILCSQKVEKLIVQNNNISGIKTTTDTFFTSKVILATGGLGYPQLGATGDGYEIVKELGHKITELYPAMLPLTTKESWTASCKADTISKVQIKIDLPKAKKLNATGDLIFTQKGIRGPVVLDFAREITPFLDKYKEVPILINLTHGMNEDDILNHIKKQISIDPNDSIVNNLKDILPYTVAQEICLSISANPNERYKNLQGIIRNKLIKTLAWTPLTVIGHEGFKKAMITRGGISLKQINPKTMQSKIIEGLYFCGEIVDLDGPCGGYNLQWSFSSGYLAGCLL